MTDDYRPRTAAEIPEEELEEMIRDVLGYSFRPDIGERAIAWLDERLAVYKLAIAMGIRRSMTNG